MSRPLLDVNDLTKHYPITEGVLGREVGRVRAVDGISFTLGAGETLGLVGESGCGKSTAATTMLRLEEPTAGQVVFDGADVTAFGRRELKRFRRRAQMIFQDPTSSFDPRMTVGESVAEPLRVHGLRDRERRRRIVSDLLERVGLSATDFDRYPHEFSGGQKQRIALARALVVNPDLVVADEPVSALDVSVQADILRLIERVQSEFSLAMLIISHDMAVVREVCDRVAVMYLGEIVETAPTAELFDDPQHPYTRALLSSVPTLNPRERGRRTALTGDVPSPSDPPPGCRFHTRCPEVIPPDDLDLDQSTWRAVLDLRLRVARGAVDLDAVREYVVGPNAPPEAADPDAMQAAIRREFGVPETLGDADAEAALAAALDHVTTGDLDAAGDRLAVAFPTVCRDEHPDGWPTGFDVAPAEWAAIQDLRTWAATLDPNAPDVTGRTGEAATDAERRERLRESFGLPETLDDPSAERAVAGAIDDLLSGCVEDATTALYGTFEPHHAAACHLVTRDRERAVDPSP